MQIRNEETFQLYVDFCKILANPKRLRILALLSSEEKSIGEPAASMDTAMNGTELNALTPDTVIDAR